MRNLWICEKSMDMTRDLCFRDKTSADTLKGEKDQHMQEKIYE